MPAEHYQSKLKNTSRIPFLIVLLLFQLCALSQPVSGKNTHLEKSNKIISENLLLFTENGIYQEIAPAEPIKNEEIGFKMDWNWVIYFSILLVVFYIIRRYELSRMRLRNQMRIANIETGKLKEIDQLKTRFYANISHEFRTPLTLIKGPLEQLIEESTDPQTRKIYGIMHGNASRLLELINQLLDLSKIENGNYTLNTHKDDIVNFIEGLAMSYLSLADQKSITLEVKICPELLENEARNSFYFDPDILDKIVNNLIANAFKFTPETGKITVTMDIVREDQKIAFLEIVIEDTGIGIEPDQLPHIFDRFYQADPLRNSGGSDGTGVGLSIVSELIRVHKGKIFVRSTPGSGTIFRVHIPSGKHHLSPDEIGDIVSRYSHDTLPTQLVMPEEIINPGSKIIPDIAEKPWVLVVEDHDQVRGYIIDSIQKEYRILQTANAADGFEKAQEYIPDLIISDIMMPGIDGFKFCEQIKNSEKTSHIPIILLTAKADMNDRITGLKWGADDYLTKPFNPEELRTRIGNLIENRIALRKKFSTTSIIRPGEISVSSHDASFIKNLLDLIEENMDNFQYSVETFAKDAGLSLSQLHRKLKAIINMSAIQFITSVRMHRAMELIKNDTGNIAEIAYMVGYDDPGYFSKSFRKFFDKLPSEVSRK